MVVTLITKKVNVCTVQLGLHLQHHGRVLATGGTRVRVTAHRLVSGRTRVRGMATRGLRFFAGVARRVHAPLALVLGPLSDVIGQRGSPRVRHGV